MACSVGKVCTYTLLMTVCSTSNMREKHEGIKLTKAVAGINSLNSNRWNPWKQGNASKGCQKDPGRTRKTTEKLEEACRRYRSSSVHHDRFPPFLRQAWWYVFSLQSWSRPGPLLPSLDCSSTNSFLTFFLVVNPSRSCVQPDNKTMCTDAPG